MILTILIYYKTNTTLYKYHNFTPHILEYQFCKPPVTTIGHNLHIESTFRLYLESNKFPFLPPTLPLSLYISSRTNNCTPVACACCWIGVVCSWSGRGESQEKPRCSRDPQPPHRPHPLHRPRRKNWSLESRDMKGRPRIWHICKSRGGFN